MNRLAHTMALLLSKGADPGIRNLAGDSAMSVGNSLTQTALGSALAAASGQANLEPEAMDHNSVPEASDEAGSGQHASQVPPQECDDPAAHVEEENAAESRLEDSQEDTHEKLNEQDVSVDLDAAEQQQGEDQQAATEDAEQGAPDGNGPGDTVPADGAAADDGEEGGSREATPAGSGTQADESEMVIGTDERAVGEEAASVVNEAEETGEDLAVDQEVDTPTDGAGLEAEPEAEEPAEAAS